MTEQEELKMLRDRCANLEKNYRDGWPKTVADARKEGHAQAAQEYEALIERLRGLLTEALSCLDHHNGDSNGDFSLRADIRKALTPLTPDPKEVLGMKIEVDPTLADDEWKLNKPEQRKAREFWVHRETLKTSREFREGPGWLHVREVLDE